MIYGKELEKIVDEVIESEQDAKVQINANPDDTNNIVNFLVGKVMQKTRGNANPAETMQLIREKLQ